MNEQALVAKVWNYAHVLRDDGVSFGDYLGQISFLLFLKMDKERTEHLGEPSALQKDSLLDRGNASYDVILTNPPFGGRQSFRIVREDGDDRENAARRAASATRSTPAW